MSRYRTPSFKKERICFACGINGPTEWHHIQPRSEGGKDTRRNLVELCVSCHDKGEELGWAWISEQYGQRFGGFGSSHRARKTKPSITLKPGEALRYDSNARVWKRWGVDASGIYAAEV